LCDEDCKNFIFFITFVAISFLLDYMIIVPNRAVVLR
jgi:hypothetical protein